MKYFILMMFSILVFACGNTTVKEEVKNPELIEEERLKDEIHRLHDVETMPQMAYMMKLGKQLDSLKGADEILILKLKEDLKKADDDMMDWMVQFNWQDEPTPVAHRVKYYTVEVDKLEELKTVILSAIDGAEKELKN